MLGAVSALSLMVSAPVSANDDDRGFYLRGNAGYGIHTEDGISGDITSDVAGIGVESEGDPSYSVGLGYDFGNSWRLEVDTDYLQTDLGAIAELPGSSAKLRTTSVMLNALYDFNEGGRIQPFIGAGVGLVNGNASLVAHDFVNANGLNTTPACVGPRTVNQAESCNIQDFDRGFGWQLLAGLGYRLTDNLTWDTHYTFLNGPSLDLFGSRTNGVTGGVAPINASIEDIGAHTIVTGLRYRFGQQAAPKVVDAPPPPPVKSNFTCWDGKIVENAGQCAAQPAPVRTKTCWDGSTINADATCPAQPETFTCWDGTLTYDLGTCPVQQTAVITRPNLNLCGESAVAIFNVPAGAQPKTISRLGTLPEFGDSHGLTPTQFYEKLDARYKSNATDKAYLNYLFKSMGYANGWADAQAYMFSDETLPVGTRGILGLGKQHHYQYSILPADDRDRQAFRIQSANGAVVHFMKTCGNYMYACE